MSYPRILQIHNIGNSGNIAICVFPHIFSFLLYSNCIVLVNATFYNTGHKRNTFQSWILQWSSKWHSWNTNGNIVTSVVSEKIL